MFRSTPLREGRPVAPEVLVYAIPFRSTPLREGRPAETHQKPILRLFRSTPLREGRQGEARRVSIEQMFRSTPLREGRLGASSPSRRGPDSVARPLARAREPGRPNRDAARRRREAAAGAGADPLRPDAGLAVRFLPRRGGGHGRGPRVDAGQRRPRSGERRCASPQFRRLRHARTTARVRHQRSRRDLAGPVGMGHQAPRRLVRAGRPRQRTDELGRS